MIISALQEGGPVVMIEHRRLYDETQEVPEGIYSVAFGQARVVIEGKDIPWLLHPIWYLKLKKLRIC